MNERLRPLRVLPNPVRRPQFGAGTLVAPFRESQDAAPAAEDWTASDVRPRSATPGEETGLGRVRLSPDETATVADLIAADPEGMLGRDHLGRWGTRLGFLAKIFDPDRRIPIHCHPTRDFAREHFGSPVGKTEAWIVLADSGISPNAWIGFRDDVTEERWCELVDAQDGGILAALNPVTLRAGDVLVVPAGNPHSLGPGLLVIEPQEACDWSFLAEYAAYGVSRSNAELGLGTEAALSAFARTRLDPAAVEERLITRGALQDAPDGVTPLAPAGRPFFAADVLRTRSRLTVAATGPRVLVAIAGTGTVIGGGCTEEVRPGDVFFLPGGVPSVTIAARDDALTIASIGAGDTPPAQNPENPS